MEAAHLAHLTRSGQTLMSKVKCPNKAMEQARRMTILGLVECMSSQGYTEWEPKYHINGRHNNISLTLSDDWCPKCDKQCKILYDIKCGQVTKGCLSGSCPAKIFAVEVDHEGTMSVLHYEEVDSRRCRMPKVSGMLSAAIDSQELQDDYLVKVGVNRGLMLIGMGNP